MEKEWNRVKGRMRKTGKKRETGVEREREMRGK